MATNRNLTFIESPNFPIELVNEASAKEKKGGGRPEFWEMVFWWTRKPLASARAIIAGALLPYDFPRERFIRMLNLHVVHDKSARIKTPHRLNPIIPRDIHEKYFKGKSLLDPFAGFGSIPLEALRLRLSKVVAVELLPTAYIFLKAVLEYPLKAVKSKEWRQLIDDVKKYGKEIIKQLQNDPDIKELYDPDVAVYIGTWEIKHGDHWTPLIGNWWLARVKDKKGWKALAWMERVKTNEGVKIKVVDAKKQYAKQFNNITTFRHGRRTVGIIINGKRIYVGWSRLNGEPNIDAKREKAVCLYCGGEITNKVIDPETNERVWYVKYALRTWNRLLEDYLEGKISLEELKEKTPARPTILVKVKVINDELVFEEATEKDNERLWKALERLKQLWGDPDTPPEPFAPYQMGTAGAFRITLWGFDKSYKLFNPRQLLTLVKLVKLIREAGKKIENEKLREGWGKEEAFRYAEAVTTYLAIALLRSVNYNSITTYWKPDSWVLNKAQCVLTFRGISMTWNWAETVITSNVPYSWVDSVSTVNESLSYLISAISGYSSNLLGFISRAKNIDDRVVEVFQDDALILSKLREEKYDLIVTDPPYYDDVPYSELSDFYYVWLKRALSDNDGYSLIPRFLREAFFDEWGNEIETQWSVFSRSEITLNPGRFKYFGLIEENKDVGAKGRELYADMLARAFEAMASKLKDNGLLITYFAHSDPDAWKALIYAGWRRAGLLVSTAYPLITESEESVVARGKAAITASIVVIWRKRDMKANPEPMLDLSQRRDELVEALSQEFRKYISMGIHGTSLYVMLYAKALSEITKYAKVVDGAKELSVDDIVLEASKLVSRAVVKGANPEIVTPEAAFYLLFKLVGVRPKGGGRRKLPSSDLILVGYGTLGLDKAEKLRIIRPAKARATEEEEIEEAEEVEGAEVAKRKVFELLEPREDSEGAILELLGLKGVDPGRAETIRTSIDVLHVLELYADRGREEVKRKYAELAQALGWRAKEAIELAKSLVYLESWRKDPKRRDPEALRCERLLKQLGIEVAK